MSLLLDALKRAEQEKLARQGAQPAPAQPAPVQSAPAPSAPSAHKASFELEAIDSGPASPKAAAPAADAGARGAAQAMFAAKREAPASARTSRTPLIVGAVVVVLALLAGGGGYVWYQIRSLAAPQRPLASVRPVTPAPQVAPPAAPKAEPVSSPPPLAMLKPGEGVDAKKARPARDAAQQAVMDLLNESRAAPPPPPLKLTRSLQPAPALADVTGGYEALRRGDAAGAKGRYQAALAIDGSNLDALLGLATAEARLGEREPAARHYRRALQVDPRNANALAGLAALADFSRPEALEAQLRGDLTRYPQSAALHFTLGNLLASQSRWADAQAAFFEAHRLEPADADIAYNLAVALDQLGQPRPAADFYARAIAQARGRGAHFDPRAAEKRLAELRR